MLQRVEAQDAIERRVGKGKPASIGADASISFEAIRLKGRWLILQPDKPGNEVGEQAGPAADLETGPGQALAGEASTKRRSLIR